MAARRTEERPSRVARRTVRFAQEARDLGLHLRALREDLELTLEQAAERMDVAPKHLQKIEAGKMQIESVPFEPATLITDVVRLMTPAMNDKGLQPNLSLPADLPEFIAVDLSGLEKNLRRGDDGRYRWHWDPRLMETWNPDRYDPVVAKRIVEERLAHASRLHALFKDANVLGATHEAKALEHLDSSMHLVAPIMGERLDIRAPALSTHWWRKVQPESVGSTLTERSTVLAPQPDAKY